VEAPALALTSSLSGDTETDEAKGGEETKDLPHEVQNIFPTGFAVPQDEQTDILASSHGIVTLFDTEPGLPFYRRQEWHEPTHHHTQPVIR
jgi:hypothetical protein